MEDGALGLSTGLEYLPGMFAPQWEIVALAKVAGQYGGLYVTHLRDEGLKVFEAVKEALEIGHKAKVNVHLSPENCCAKVVENCNTTFGFD
jgi:N-acyl-D-aspartate/D-glutamate deacylase